MAQIIYINEINENIETAKNEVETERLVKWFLWSHHWKICMTLSFKIIQI